MSNEERKKPRTSAAVKNRYNKKAYRRFMTQIKPDLNDKILNYLEAEQISRPEFLQRAIDALEERK